MVAAAATIFLGAISSLLAVFVLYQMNIGRRFTSRFFHLPFSIAQKFCRRWNYANDTIEGRLPLKAG